MKALSLISRFMPSFVSCLEKLPRKMGLPPRTGTDEKIFLGHAVWVFEAKLSPFSTAKNIKRKPLTNTSQVTFTLTFKLIISTKK